MRESIHITRNNIVLGEDSPIVDGLKPLFKGQVYISDTKRIFMARGLNVGEWNELKDTGIIDFDSFATSAELDEVKLSVTNGKELVATAISDKGVPALGSDSFQILGDKIRLIGGEGLLNMDLAVKVIVQQNAPSEPIQKDLIWIQSSTKGNIHIVTDQKKYNLSDFKEGDYIVKFNNLKIRFKAKEWMNQVSDLDEMYVDFRGKTEIPSNEFNFETLIYYNDVVEIYGHVAMIRQIQGGVEKGVNSKYWNGTNWASIFRLDFDLYVSWSTNYASSRDAKEIFYKVNPKDLKAERSYQLTSANGNKRLGCIDSDGFIYSIEDKWIRKYDNEFTVENRISWSTLPIVVSTIAEGATDLSPANSFPMFYSHDDGKIYFFLQTYASNNLRLLILTFNTNLELQDYYYTEKMYIESLYSDANMKNRYTKIDNRIFIKGYGDYFYFDLSTKTLGKLQCGTSYIADSTIFKAHDGSINVMLYYNAGLYKADFETGKLVSQTYASDAYFKTLDSRYRVSSIQKTKDGYYAVIENTNDSAAMVCLKTDKNFKQIWVSNYSIGSSTSVYCRNFVTEDFDGNVYFTCMGAYRINTTSVSLNIVKLNAADGTRLAASSLERAYENGSFSDLCRTNLCHIASNNPRFYYEEVWN